MQMLTKVFGCAATSIHIKRLVCYENVTISDMSEDKKNVQKKCTSKKIDFKMTILFKDSWTFSYFLGGRFSIQSSNSKKKHFLSLISKISGMNMSVWKCAQRQRQRLSKISKQSLSIRIYLGIKWSVDNWAYK